MLLVGFAVSRRSALEPVSLELLLQFCDNYLNMKPSLATLSRIMAQHGFSCQKALSRNSRMASAEVVDDAIDALEEIRSFHYPPHRILSMDETGLWSNVAAPKTYHFRNWSAILVSSQSPAPGRHADFGRQKLSPFSVSPLLLFLLFLSYCIGVMQ